MTTLTGTSLTFTDTVTDDASLGLNAAYDTATAVIGGVTYVYISGFTDDAIQVATLSSDGALTPVGVINDTGGTTLNGAFRLETFEVGGTQFLAAGGYTDDGVTLFTLSGSAPYLTFTDRAFDSDDPDTNLSDASDLQVLDLSGGTFLYVAGRFSDGLSVFSVDGAGTLTNVQNIDDDATLELNGAAGLSGFVLDGTQYLLATGFFEDGVTVFSVNQSTGELTETDSFDGFASGTLDGAYLADATVIGGTAYLYVPETNGDAITVLGFDGSTINQVQRIAAPAALNGAFDATVIALGDRLVLAVSASNADQLHLFEIDSNPLSPGRGGLTPLQSLTDGMGEGALDSPNSSTVVRVGGTDFLLVTASGDSAVNVYEIGGADDVLEGTNGADDLSGGAGDDTLVGLGGDDEISGDPGDDEISGGSGDDTLTGGSGDDEISGGSGDDDAEGGAGADRIEGGSGRDFIRGNAGSDWIHGGSDDDLIAANDGADTLRGGDGDDRMFGGRGADLMAGNNGNDEMDGSIGADRMFGGTGNDTMLGGGDDDDMHGGNGADDMRGEDGNDTLRGENGADDMRGDSGDDLIAANDGADTVRGGDGDDRMFGGRGADVMAGNNGNDEMDGSIGADRMFGGNGNDTMLGGGDDDEIRGDNGADDLRGEDGNDTLRGGDGADTLFGGAGQDELSGSIGADVFVFETVADSIHGFATRDQVTDFEAGIDMIDLSGFGGLTFVTSYTDGVNEVRYDDGNGRLYVNTDGGSSDFSVDLGTGAGLTVDDLIL